MERKLLGEVGKRQLLLKTGPRPQGGFKLGDRPDGDRMSTISPKFERNHRHPAVG